MVNKEIDDYIKTNCNSCRCTRECELYDTLSHWERNYDFLKIDRNPKACVFKNIRGVNRVS